MTNIRMLGPISKNGAERQSNIELLRILAMFFIVAAHWGHAFNGISYSKFSLLNLCFFHVFRGFGQIGVVSYLLISGYFLSKSNFKIQSFLRIALQILLYSCVIIVAYHIIFPENKWTVGRIVAYIVLLSNGDFWFVGPYIIMFLLSPFINIAIRRLSKKQFLILLIIYGWFDSILLSIIGNQIWDNEKILNVFNFVFIYLVGAFIRFFNEETKDKKFVYIVCAFFAVVYILLQILPCVLHTRSEISTYFQARSNFVTIIFAVFLFLAFKQTRIKYNKTINMIGASTFGVYLLHENSLVRENLWRNVLHFDQYMTDDWLIWYSILAVVCVFAVCSAIDIVRKQLLEKPVFVLIDKKLGKQLQKINKLFVVDSSYSPAEDTPIKYFWVHIIYLTLAVIMSNFIPQNNFIVFLEFMLFYVAIWFVIWFAKRRKEKTSA